MSDPLQTQMTQTCPTASGGRETLLLVGNRVGDFEVEREIRLRM